MPHYDAWQVTVSSCLQKASTNVIIWKIIFYLLAMFEANYYHHIFTIYCCRDLKNENRGHSVTSQYAEGIIIHSTIKARVCRDCLIHGDGPLSNFFDAFDQLCEISKSPEVSIKSDVYLSSDDLSAHLSYPGIFVKLIIENR